MWTGFGGQAVDSVWQNNTVALCTRASSYSADSSINVRYYNNIIANGDNVWYDWSAGVPQNAGFIADRNSLFNSIDRVWISEGGQTRTFAQWQADGFDLNGLFSDPLFTDQNSGDYTLEESSPAIDLGRDYLNLTGQGTNTVINAGCYITGDEVMGPRISLPGD
jgi:hypothetical protein